MGTSRGPFPAEEESVIVLSGIRWYNGACAARQKRAGKRGKNEQFRVKFRVKFLPKWVYFCSKSQTNEQREKRRKRNTGADFNRKPHPVRMG